jgi:hypothetical protein
VDCSTIIFTELLPLVTEKLVTRIYMPLKSLENYINYIKSNNFWDLVLAGVVLKLMGIVKHEADRSGRNV